MTRFWLAMDHSRQELFRSNGSGDVRPDLVDVANDVGWGIVISPDYPPTGTSLDPARVCLGMPDLLDQDAVASLTLPVTSATSVKVGFAHIDGADCGSTARAILNSARDFSRHYLEPYCLNTDCLRSILSVAQGAHESVTLKFAVDKDSLQALSTAGPLPTWLARSDGIPWLPFFAQLRIARASGCVGAMVGRALWGDSVAISGEDRRALVRNRMQLIGDVFRDFTLAP